ncbi:MAG: hypothetical protein JXA09_10060 [Anaerolineae bacterium]|nr:hypothetical protein [Anaerolineae bacterium]
MDFEGYVGYLEYRERIKRAEHAATNQWRFRNIKSPETKFLTAVVTSVLGLFIR